MEYHSNDPEARVSDRLWCSPGRMLRRIRRLTAGSTAAPPPVVTAVGPIPGPQTASTAPANPYAADRTAMGEGRQLFVRFNCSGCHGGRAGGGMGPSLRDVDWIYGNNDAQLFSSIAEGRAHGMPSWQTRLTSDQTGSSLPTSNRFGPGTSLRRRHRNRGHVYVAHYGHGYVAATLVLMIACSQPSSPAETQAGAAPI